MAGGGVSLRRWVVFSTLSTSLGPSGQVNAFLSVAGFGLSFRCFCAAEREHMDNFACE